MVKLFYINFYSRFIIGGKLFQYVLSIELNAQIVVIGMVLWGKFEMITFLDNRYLVRKGNNVL